MGVASIFPNANSMNLPFIVTLASYFTAKKYFSQIMKTS